MWFDSDGALLPGLLPGLYRGITFHVPDASTAAGRRIAQQLFPGIDNAAYDDFGVYPNEVTIDGIIVGDDYVAQGAALIAALNTPGPATLVHPWLGPMTVMLRDPGEVSFSDRELRVVRFSATFTKVDNTGFASTGSSLTALRTAISSATSAASALCLATGIKVLSAMRQKASERSHRIVSETIAALSAPSGSARAVPRLKALVPSPSIDPAAFDAMMSGFAEVISAVAPSPAVAPAAEAVIETAPSSSALVAIGQQIAAALLPAIEAAPSDIDAAMLASAAGRMIAATSAQAIYVDYDSRAAALTYRSDAIALIDDVTDALDAASAGVLSGEASGLRRSLRALQAAVILDINETLGRLPPVQVFEPGRPIDAFQLAHHIAGNRPETVEAVYLDIVSRNRPRHPAYLDAARIEVKI